MTISSGLRIGITVGLSAPSESLWNNGIKQNAAFLAEALRHCRGVRSVHLVNTTDVPVTGALPWDTQRWPTVSFDVAKDALDVLIELGGQVDAVQTDYLKRRGTRLVSYCCGSEYVCAVESMIFGRPSFGSGLFVNQRYDAIWMVPQVARGSEHFFTTLRRRPAAVVPFVWDPVFLQQRAAALADGGEYRPRPGPRRLSVMEPNIDVVKFCLYPVLIAERAYRARPDLVAHLHVTNAEQLARASAEFVAVMNQLDIVRDRKASFVGRYDTPEFLGAHTDVVVSHQWDNPLNYFYLEVCWQGYPLVHNADLCSDLGYHYPGNDVPAGAQQLLRALQEHDLHGDAYREAQRRAIQRHRPDDVKVVSTYEGLLAQVVQGEPA